jgi:type I restriction enzyme R subunit
MEDMKELMKPPFDKPVSFVKLFDMKTRTALIEKIHEIKENAVHVVT